MKLFKISSGLKDVSVEVQYRCEALCMRKERLKFILRQVVSCQTGLDFLPPQLFIVISGHLEVREACLIRQAGEQMNVQWAVGLFHRLTDLSLWDCD